MEIGGKRVLVTGADGFIGSHLTELLVARGARVRALAQYNSFSTWGWLEEVPCRGDVEIVPGDVRDARFVREVTAGMDVVFHLAALIAIPYSYVAPASYVDTNVHGTLNVLQAARDLGVKRVVHTSTSEVYGTARYVPIDEKHPLQPQSPYSASKIGADALATSFHLSFGLPVVTVRPFNTFGPRQSARAVISTIIVQALAGKPRLRLGSLTPTRDFTYVADTCRAFIALAESDAAVGQVVNAGSNREISIGDLVETIGRLAGVRLEVEHDPQRVRPAASEVERLWSDCSRLMALTGFSPQTPLDEGLRRTIEWFRVPGRLSKFKADVYNV